MKIEEMAALITDEKQKAAFLEAMKNEYVLKADFTQHTQKQGEEAKKLQEENDTFRSWYREKYEPYIAVAEPILQAHYARQNGNPNPNPGNPNPNPGQNWYDGWDTLPGERQAQVLEQKVREAQMAALTEKEKTYQQALEQWGKNLADQLQGQFAVFVEAQQRKAQDPDLDVLKYMDRVKKFAPAHGINPFDEAYRAETYDRDKEKWLNEGRKLGKQDAETEFKSKPGNIPPITPPSTLQPYKNPEIKQADRRAALTNAVTEKFGSKVWQP